MSSGAPYLARVRLYLCLPDGTTKNLIFCFPAKLGQYYLYAQAHMPLNCETLFRASSSISSSRWQNVSTSPASSLNVNLNSFHWYSREPSALTEPKTFPSTSNPFLSTERRKASFKQSDESVIHIISRKSSATQRRTKHERSCLLVVLFACINQKPELTILKWLYRWYLQD